MSAINDLFNSILGKQDKALVALDSIQAELAASKSALSDRDATISKLTSDLAVANAQLATLNADKSALEAAISKHAEELAAKDAEVDKRAAAKALEVTAKQGQPPVALGAAPQNPAQPQAPAETKLTGLARVAAAINKEIGNRK